MDVLVCLSCGERYYDKKTLKQIEEMRSRLKRHDLEVEEVGKVFKEHVT